MNTDPNRGAGFAGTILLVEDDPNNRDLALKILRSRGYAVTWAGTGVEALAQAREVHPDLILMDLSLPEMDGWEATRRLKADPSVRHIPVIAATAHAMVGDREKALDAGCDAYFTKPYLPADLRATVERYLPLARV
jgi:two-component system, cell cycle response regulator DivK